MPRLQTKTQILKDMSAKAENSEDIWNIHEFLSKQRKTMDEKYDYSTSVLMLVLARLIRENWITENELEGLDQEKINVILSVASM
ncbi:hypothetical protein [Methylomonas sp. AM2-LC]|uniref:hypothetical protein n=1 Tax=Methylomonas sp. AM2-LC TaxID=3153301 RepID=UPI0032634DF5